MTPIFRGPWQATSLHPYRNPAFDVVLVLFASRGVWAQANAGVTGTVTDSRGAVIPNANVTIANEGTSVSGQDGDNRLWNIFLHRPYSRGLQVTVEKAGFKKAVQTHVNVEVTVTSTINFSLRNGATTETVQVEARADCAEHDPAANGQHHRAGGREGAAG